jgi:hypothetical protein
VEFAEVAGVRMAYELNGSGASWTVVLAGGSVWVPKTHPPRSYNHAVFIDEAAKDVGPSEVRGAGLTARSREAAEVEVPVDVSDSTSAVVARCVLVVAVKPRCPASEPR